jgi:hypothetical protein
MDSDLRPFRRRLAFLADMFGALRRILTPHAPEVRTQRMCPFCGLITPRSKAFCLECGKSLAEVRLVRQDAR